MDLKELESKYKGDVFGNLPNGVLLSKAGEWVYHSSVLLNAPVAIGWLLNEDLLVINSDGIFAHNILKNSFVHEDYETTFHKYLSSDNLTFYFKAREESVSVFGLRGGGGNLLTKDCKWKLESVNLSWNVKVPRLLNYKTGEAYFLELHQVSYEGNLYLGFSRSEKYFVIMGDSGIDIYFKEE